MTFSQKLGPTNSVANAGVSNFDPVLISLIRRAMPNLVAYDLAGVQPMNGPTGLIFAMRSRFTNMTGTEAFYNEADTSFSNSGLNDSDPYVVGTGASTGADSGFGTTQTGTNPGVLTILMLPTMHILLDKVWTQQTLKTSRLVYPSRRWHSRSRRSPLLPSQEH